MKIGDQVEIIDARYKDIATLCGNFEASSIGIIVGIEHRADKAWYQVEVDEIVLTFPENWLKVIHLN